MESNINLAIPLILGGVAFLSLLMLLMQYIIMKTIPMVLNLAITKAANLAPQRYDEEKDSDDPLEDDHFLNLLGDIVETSVKLQITEEDGYSDASVSEYLPKGALLSHLRYNWNMFCMSLEYRGIKDDPMKLFTRYRDKCGPVRQLPADFMNHFTSPDED